MAVPISDPSELVMSDIHELDDKLEAEIDETTSLEDVLNGDRKAENPFSEQDDDVWRCLNSIHLVSLTTKVPLLSTASKFNGHLIASSTQEKSQKQPVEENM